MWRLAFCQLDMDAVYLRRRKKILVIRLAKPISNPEIYRRVSSVVGEPDKQIVCKANRQQNYTASGIVGYKKIMKAARDQQLDFCSSFCNKVSSVSCCCGCTL